MRLDLLWGGVLCLFLFSCSKLDEDLSVDIIEEAPQIISIKFLAKDNPLNLINDIDCTIIGDSLATCYVPYLMTNKQLVMKYESVGEVSCEGQYCHSGVTKIDYSRPVLLKVTNGDKEKVYKVFVHSFTGLPIVWVETERRQTIKSKDKYLKAHFKLVEDVVTRSEGDVIEKEISIRGRGNYTWSAFPKKPYKIKFEKKISIFDDPMGKTWVLLANHFDKTMLRNKLVFSLGHMSNLDYTPRSHFVELILNGKYEGTYQLTENLKISENRSRGILLEVDRYATAEEDSRFFTTEHLDFPVNIKDPDVEYGDETYNAVKEFFLKTEEALFSNNFKDENEGWRKYIDIDTIVDWYIITELAKDAECIYMLCHMTWEPGGKLKMGPLWDYDMSFGNYYSSYFEGCQDPCGFYLKKTKWFTRLFEDECFVNALKKRYEFFYGNKDIILQEINDNALYLQYSAKENNNRWNVLYQPDPNCPHNYDVWGNYYNEVQNLKLWLIDRMEWMRNALSEYKE